jgi:transcriptional regulator GlxA family with amidase domain
MRIAILTFEGFNELDSLIALGILNRTKKPDWRVTLSCPSPVVTSMNGVRVHAQSSLEEAGSADSVIIGSGMQTREIVATPGLMAALQLDPRRQLIMGTGRRRVCRILSG